MTDATTAVEGGYAMKVTSDIYVPMRDGTRLAVRIYRPDAEGEFPALFAASPYRYDTDDLPHSTLFLWREIGPVEWYVAHGYAYVHADVRGTGKSDGTYRFMDTAEQQDYYELIEWIGRQPWCDGNVGGFGQSYYAWSQWFMGIVNPPSLKCIAPYDGAVDIYRGTAYHGGIYCDFMTWWYNIVRVNNLHRAANAPTGKAMEYDVGWEFISRQTYDDWWRERNPYERLSEIEVPVLSIGHWGKLGLHLRGNILGYEEVTAPKKLVVTGAKDVFEAHDMFDKIDYHERELLPFYDHYLKGIDNGFMDGAPVRLFVRGEDAWREEAEWPLARAETVSFYLRKGPSDSVASLNDGGMATEPPGAEEPTEFNYPDPGWKLGVVGMGPGGPDPVRRVLTYTTHPLDEDVEVTGPIVLELYASSDQPDTEFVVKLSDQQPQLAEDMAGGNQPAFTVVTKGWLKASHREKDLERSTPQRPFYTHNNPQPLEPGEVYKFEIEVMPASYLFRKGHRIRLEIVNGDSPLTDSIFTHQYIPFKVGCDTIYHDAERPSRLLLPVVPRG